MAGNGSFVGEGTLDQECIGAARQFDYGLTVLGVTRVYERAAFSIQLVGDALAAVLRRGPREPASGQVDGGWAFLGQLRDERGVVAGHPLSPDLHHGAPEPEERLGTGQVERQGTFLGCAVVDGEEERNDVYRMVWMEVRKEDAVYGEGIEARPEHAAHRARTEVEDKRLPTGPRHDAALAPLQAWNYGARSYDGDLHVPPFGRHSISACQVLSLFRYIECCLGWLLFERPGESGDTEQGPADDVRGPVCPDVDPARGGCGEEDQEGDPGRSVRPKCVDGSEQEDRAQDVSAGVRVGCAHVEQ